jgi:hypothetical protein
MGSQSELVSPKFQKLSELKFDGRTIPPKAEDIEDIRGIPVAKRNGTIRSKIFRELHFGKVPLRVKIKAHYRMRSNVGFIALIYIKYV